MKPQYEIELKEIISRLKEEIVTNEKNIEEILPDGRFMEANNYSVYNSALEEAIILIESALTNLQQS